MSKENIKGKTAMPKKRSAKLTDLMTDDVELCAAVIRDVMAKRGSDDYWKAEEIADATGCTDTEKIITYMDRLEEEGEVEADVCCDEVVWKLSCVGRLRQEKPDDWESILEANYIYRLIKQHSEMSKDESTGNGAVDPAYIEEIKDQLPVFEASPESGPVPVAYDTLTDKADIVLLTPDKRRVFDADGNLRQAVVLPMHFSPETLEHDVDKGAFPFKKLLDMSTTDLNSQIIFIRSTKFEFALNAAIYLAAKQNAIDQIEENDCVDPYAFDLEEYDPGESLSHQNVLPMATVDEMLFRPGDVGINFGELNASGAAHNTPKIPYWLDHDGAMIIINSTSGFYMGDEMLSDALSRVVNNKRHIYVINVESTFQLPDEEDCDATFVPFGSSGYLKALVKYNASAVDLPTDDDTDYFDKILSGLCNKHGLIIPADYPRKDLLLRLNKVMNDMRAEFLNQLLFREASKNESKELSTDLLKLLGRLEIGESKRLKGWELLDSLEGIETTKAEIRGLVNAMKMNKARRKRGLKCEPIVGCLFTGAPGTSKTTCAQALSDILAEEELLPGGRFTSVSGAGLMAEYVGQTCKKVRNLVDNSDVCATSYAFK